MSASMVDRVHCESLARWPGLEKKKVEGSSQQKCAECQSTAQGTSGHARPVNDDLQGALGDFVGTNSTQHRCKCMRVDEYVHAYAGLRECQPRHFPACCLMVNERSDTIRLMVIQLELSTAC